MAQNRTEQIFLWSEVKKSEVDGDGSMWERERESGRQSEYIVLWRGRVVSVTAERESLLRSAQRLTALWQG